MTNAEGSEINLCMCTCKYTQLRPAYSIPMFIVRVGGH